MNGPTAAVKTPKGPLVWLDMDQKELDDAYDQLVYAPNRDQLTKRRIANSAAARARIGEPLRFAYGPTPIEGLDLYHSASASRGKQGGERVPVAIFVHGGAWRSGSASEFTFLAEPFVHAGAHFAVLDFTNVNDTGGSLFPMAEQVRRAIGWVFRNAEQFGGDRDRLYLISHSSGSHLAGCAVTHDWSEDGLPRDIIKGATLSSGMYDLKPVRLSKRSQYVNFTDAMENELSAIRQLDRLATPLIVSYGTYETPEFQRQTRDFAAAVKAARKPVQLLVGEAYNHFEMLETLGNPYGLLGRAVLAQMGLKKESEKR
ncbi:MAG: alpha/beta hydrolase [Xanthobacteraceae bacterium]